MNAKGAGEVAQDENIRGFLGGQAVQLTGAGESPVSKKRLIASLAPFGIPYAVSRDTIHPLAPRVRAIAART